MDFYFSLGKYKMLLFPNPWFISQYTSPNESFKHGYPHSKGFLHFPLKLKHGKPYKATRHPTCDVVKVINEISNCLYSLTAIV